MSETTPPVYNPPAYTPAPVAKTNVLAIVSLVTSILLVHLVGVVTGHIALSQIKKTGESGRGLAIAGLILGYIGLVVGILLFFFVFLGVLLAGGGSMTNF